MTRLAGTAALLAGLVAGAGCRPGRSETTARGDSAEVARRGAHLAQALAQPDSGASRVAPVAQWVLGDDLSEISGLALTTDGRLFTHGDEQGRVFELDYRRGVLLKQFTIGTHLIHADFEGITVVDDAVFLLASNGKLYEFQEAANGEETAYTLHDTRLSHECEFEGVAYDPTITSLLLACKNVRTPGPLQDSLVIYRWKLPDGGGSRPSRLTVPLSRLAGPNGWRGLHPSDITIDPVSGNYVIIAAEERAILEITPAGDLVFARHLPAGLSHAEGVAITRDSILIISTEAGHHAAAITLYRWP
jgi:uncharacterized protein YjiK